jgi:hypothetical protein
VDRDKAMLVLAARRITEAGQGLRVETETQFWYKTVEMLWAGSRGHFRVHLMLNCTQQADSLFPTAEFASIHS